MAIWMDMTYSLEVWKGGIVGIVRAELEMAKNLYACNEDIRFCKATTKGFEEIKRDSLEWLWNSKNTGDSYLQAMGRKREKRESKPMEELPEGLEKAYAYSAGRMDRINRLCHMCIMRTPKLLRFFPRCFFGITRLPLQIVSSGRMTYLKRKKNSRDIDQIYENYKTEIYPFKDGDFLFCAGWYAYSGIIKEKYISEIKTVLPNLTVAYLVYDLVLSNENTQALYEGRGGFERYLMWIATNCDYIFYGGETAKKDAERFYREKGLSVRQGYYLKFGSDVAKNIESVDIKKVKEKYKITENYILAVGTVDAKKNYTTLYHAYVIMYNENVSNIPQLVIVGGKYGDPYLSEMMDLDPKVSGKIVFARPDDDELVALYKNSRFTVLPTWYEGWSLTLPESLLRGKFCLSSDVAPLREIAGDLVDYVAPDDARKWAEKIIYYINNAELVKQYEKRIVIEFKPQTWRMCAEELNQYLLELNNREKEYLDSHIFYDLSLAFSSCVLGAPVSGILRTQLVLARYFSRRFPHVRFVAFIDSGCIELDRFTLMELMQDQSIEDAVRLLRPVFTYISNEKRTVLPKNEEHYTNGEIYWMMTSLLPGKLRRKAVEIGQRLRKVGIGEIIVQPTSYELPFEKNDIFFSTGVGFSPSVYRAINLAKKKNEFKFIQLIYDFTPILYPQVHTFETREFYIEFLEKTYHLCDMVFYGGKTAMEDGQAYQKEKKLPVRKGVPIKFGCDIVTSMKANDEKFKEQLFERLGVTGSYIMAVGSIEARKNHETLYLAYLAMMREHENLPQLIFCGYPGWKTQEFLKRLSRDERVKDKIITYTPTDDELDILYQNCEFTVLASLYEGWSLTLPESLNYGKLCICTDAAPMREIGGDVLEYVEAYDVIGWAKMIWKYHSNVALLKEKEYQIKKVWKTITWEDCAKQVFCELKKIYDKEVS